MCCSNQGILEVFVEKSWHKVSVELFEDRLELCTVKEDDAAKLDFTVHSPDGAIGGVSGNEHPLPASVAGKNRMVRVIKEETDAPGNGLGICIKGGSDCPVPMPIVITRIFESLPAHRTHALFVGDAIISVNGRDMTLATHEQALEILRTRDTIVDLEVRYLREVAFPFRPPSSNPLKNVGWIDVYSTTADVPVEPDGAPSRRKSMQHRASVPLRFSYLCRSCRSRREEGRAVAASSRVDAEDWDRTMELHSPDRSDVCRLRCDDVQSATKWLNRMYDAIQSVLRKEIDRINSANVNSNCKGQVVHMGWLTQKTPGDWSGGDAYKPVFAAVTNVELMLFLAVPTSRRDWDNPTERHSLLTTRLSHTTSPGDSTNLLFGLRSATRYGVQGLSFRAETHHQLWTWTHVIINGINQAVLLTKEVNTYLSWKGRECCLNLHYDNGFSLREASEESGDGATGAEAGRVIWSHPFERLQRSRDDGCRVLWLDLGDGEQRFDLNSNPKSFVFTLHSFLAAKISRLGL